MKKLKVYIDFDDTMVDSSKQIIKLLNQKYGLNKTIEDLKDWGYKSICGSVTGEEVEDLYKSKEFWEGLEVKEDFAKVYSKTKEFFDWIVVSKGTPLNLDFKEKWLNTNFPKCEFKGLDFSNGMSKDSVDMKGGIQIDDVTACLNTNAAIKILFKNYKNYYWNELVENAGNLYVINTWDLIGETLEFFYKNPDMCVECD